MHLVMSFFAVLAIMPVCLEWWDNGVDYAKWEESYLVHWSLMACPNIILCTRNKLRRYFTVYISIFWSLLWKFL